ncbi:hypothetical protein ABD87_22665 [Lysinibacillus sphaericus]|uniref:hypothetical protein n=1 Tax=Lysinibacillus sphaericus TaxID=1421 RepID=UPI0018CF7D56|nr:hypothetical protein [Lysinibacillus sphaericus]MBG9732230.1 hypothetical protein [Lysinibacillus sphaericus]
MSSNKAILNLPKSVVLFGSCESERKRELASIAKQYLHHGKRVCVLEVEELVDIKNHLGNSVINDDITYFSPTKMDFPEALTPLMLMSVPMYKKVFNMSLIHNLLPHFDVFLIGDAPYTLGMFIESNRLKEFTKQFTDYDKNIVIAVPQLHFLRVTPEEPMFFDATINIQINSIIDYKHELGTWMKRFGMPISIELSDPSNYVIQGDKLAVTITAEILPSDK